MECRERNRLRRGSIVFFIHLNFHMLMQCGLGIWHQCYARRWLTTYHWKWCSIVWSVGLTSLQVIRHFQILIRKLISVVNSRSFHLWFALRIVEDALALKFEWKGSGHGENLYKALNVDPVSCFSTLPRLSNKQHCRDSTFSCVFKFTYLLITTSNIQTAAGRGALPPLSTSTVLEPIPFTANGTT